MGPARKLLVELNSEENRRGMRDKVVVDAVALRELLNDHEAMESFMRAQSVLEDGYSDQEHKLSEILRSMYSRHEGSCASVLLLLMNILRPLIEERERGRFIDRVYNR